MDSTRFDRLSKQLASGATRRRVFAGLSALALSGAGALGLHSPAAAEVIAEDRERRCRRRCENHCNDNLSNKKCRRRCRRRCENRID